MGTGFVEFRQLREVGVLLLLGLFWSKSHSNGMRCLGAGNGRVIQSKILGLNAGNLRLFWAVPGQIFGLLLVHMCWWCVIA